MGLNAGGFYQSGRDQGWCALCKSGTRAGGFYHSGRDLRRRRLDAKLHERSCELANVYAARAVAIEGDKRRAYLLIRMGEACPCEGTLVTLGKR